MTIVASVAFRTPCLRATGAAAAGRFLPIALVLGCVACGSAGQTAPDWPRQESPDYPTVPVASASVSEPKGAKSPSYFPAPASSLAKEYGSKAAASVQDGQATYYSDSLAGKATASGDTYKPELFTAAHKKLPFGTVVRVVRSDRKRVTYAKINDRGPFGPAGRIIDLSRAAAEELGMIEAGIVDVRIEILDSPPAGAIQRHRTE